MAEMPHPQPQHSPLIEAHEAMHQRTQHQQTAQAERTRCYQEHAEAVLRLALTYLKDRARAEDLTHDVFERLWRQQGYDPSQGSLRSYLLMMTRSMALNLINQGSNRRSILQRWRTEFRQEQASHEQTLLAADRSAALQLCLAKLSSQQRSVLELCFIKGLPQAEVAEQLGLPLGTVKTHARRGLMAIRSLLEHSELNERLLE